MDTKVLKDAFSGKIFHPNYDETKEIAEAIEVHAEGEYPEEMMEERRPNESEMVKEYRKKIFKPITMPYVNKVFTSLNKIRRSSEWAILFDAKKVPARIVVGERLQDYLMVNFPLFESITNWAFDVLLKQMLVDPNAYIAVMPKDITSMANQYLQPYPFIFESEQVVAVQPDGVIFLSEDKCVFVENDVEYYGDIYIVVGDMTIEHWYQKSTDRRFAQEYIYEHNLGIVPAFKVKSVVKSVRGTDIINDSRLSPMLPELDEAIREYSDLQAEVVQHIYSEKWEYVDAGRECLTCRGEGSVVMAGFNSFKEICPTCKGSRVEPRGPYTTAYIKAGMPGDQQQMPTPPMGYIVKQTQVVELQDKRVDKHIYKALSAINMEFLGEAPLAQSGIAKAYDADETNNFVHSVAEDLVATMDKAIYFINEMRYSIVLPDQTARMEMLPVIVVPERFDLFSAKVIEEQLKSARESKTSPVIINAMEHAYAAKMFSSNPEVSKRVALIIKLDPLAGVSEDDKMSMKSNKGITDETYIISCNIGAFIDRAVRERGEEFYSLTDQEQIDIIAEYAKEQKESSSTAATILTNLGNEGLQVANPANSGQGNGVQ